MESVISKFLEPLEGVPFPIVIKALTGCKVLNFDPTVKRNKVLLEKLSKAATIAGQNAYKEGIFTKRPNEAGNHIEPFVIEALRKVGLKADRPISRSGKKKTAGYPDIEILGDNGIVVYLDCKTYSKLTKNQSFRTFYLSPSKDPKITFELDMATRKGKKAFIPVSWQIYTLEKLLVQVKHEFNASNRELYIKDALLAKGKIKR